MTQTILYTFPQKSPRNFYPLTNSISINIVCSGCVMYVEFRQQNKTEFDIPSKLLGHVFLMILTRFVDFEGPLVIKHQFKGQLDQTHRFT